MSIMVQSYAKSSIALDDKSSKLSRVPAKKADRSSMAGVYLFVDMICSHFSRLSSGSSQSARCFALEPP
jgi:hypothetical protein